MRDDVQWGTPDHILDAVRQYGDIGLDPASSPDFNLRVMAKRFYSLEAGEDGLTLPWDVAPGDFVFVNPPYGRQLTAAWVARIAAELEKQRLFAVLPAKTATRWFHHLCHAARRNRHTVVIPVGRLKFVRPDGTAPGNGWFASAIVSPAACPVVQGLEVTPCS